MQSLFGSIEHVANQRTYAARCIPSVSSFVCSCRHKLGLSTTAFGYVFGVETSEVRAWEEGLYQPPELTTQAIANRLGLPLSTAYRRPAASPFGGAQFVHRILADVLLKLRVAAGLRQVDLAERLGVTQSLISKIEHGVRSLSLLEARDYAYALSLDLDRVLADVERAAITQVERHDHETLALRRTDSLQAELQELPFAEDLQVDVGNVASHVAPDLEEPLANDAFVPSLEWKNIAGAQLQIAVWTKPTCEVAREYGVSDSAVGRQCRRLGIPKPPCGFWARVAAGIEPHPNGAPALSWQPNTARVQRARTIETGKLIEESVCVGGLVPPVGSAENVKGSKARVPPLRATEPCRRQKEKRPSASEDVLGLCGESAADGRVSDRRIRTARLACLAALVAVPWVPARPAWAALPGCG